MSRQDVLKMAIRSNPCEIHHVEKRLENFLRAAGLSRDEIENIGIAVTEVVNNAIQHGNKNDQSKKVYLEFSRLQDRIEIRIQDVGGGFDPASVADPLQPENILKESGRGIFIVKALMDQVRYSFSEKGTTVELVKFLHSNG
ncbi:MAG: ATP-binding protein [candidate division KSB1 bacterium]|nr:ATP-binding protein [candidate division KSB1 bacterium]